MTNALYAFFAAVTLLRFVGSARARLIIWVSLSLLAFAQIGQKALPGVLLLLVLQTVLIAANSRTAILRWKFFPLCYAAVLLVLGDLLHWNIQGFSYLVLASSLDLRQPEPFPSLGQRAFSLFSFPKIVVGPIAGARDHLSKTRSSAEIFTLAFWAICKGYLGVNLWRHYMPTPLWAELHSPVDYLYFGFWNYVNLYLEFSGTCDLIAATFWMFGYDCPLNFARPYLAGSISQFWQRWHITLSHWIKNCVYIPLGGSRVPQARILLNLMLAMILSGVWHGLAWHYLAWGALQGLLLCGERLTGHEQRYEKGSSLFRGLCWLSTQGLVTVSWIIFFAKF